MRLTLTMIGLVGAVGALSACGGGERAAMLTKAEGDCVTSMTRGAPPGINPQRLCSCVVNAVSQGKSDAEVRELFKGGGPSTPPPGAQQAVLQCMTQEAGK